MTVGHARNLCVGNVFDGVGTTCVLGYADVIIVREAGNRIVDDVFKDAAETDGVVNFWFLLCGKVDALGIATTLDVEYTSVRPDMLVITDEETIWVGRQGGLSGSRKAEKEGYITLVLSYIGG